MSHFAHSQTKFSFLGRIAVLVLIVFQGLLLSAQKPAKLRQWGSEAASKGDWATAYANYKAAYLLDSASFDIRSEFALAAFEIGDFDTAALLFQQNYEKDKGQLRPDGLFYLAASQKQLGQFENAQRNYKTYIKKFKSKGQRYLVERAEHEYKSAQWALQYSSNDSTFLQSKIHTPLQSEGSESISSIHGESIFFNRLNEAGHWRIWSYKNENISEVVVNGIAMDAEIANLAFIDSSQVLFAVQLDQITKIYKGSWNGAAIENTAPVSELNTEGQVNTMPAIGIYNGLPCIYFISERGNGLGGLDIWYSLLENGRWQKPLNAGSSVNTPGDEITPHWSNDALYFSSNYRFGFGGMDVFSAKAPNGVWENAVNLGDKVNSSKHEVAFQLDPSSDSYWMSSSVAQIFCQEHLTFGCLDIFQGPWRHPKKEELTDDKRFFASLAAMNAALPVTLYFHNDEPNPRTQDTVSTLTYGDSYTAYLDLLPKYLDENGKDADPTKREEKLIITQDFFDLQVKKGYSDLDEFSELLLKELRSGHSVRVWIRGFASPRAQTEYNLNLTKRRTSSLVKHIAELDNGVFIPYLEDKATSGARLEFVQLPFGELKSKTGVSDDLNDERSSIYSRAACLERKIEIESATIMPNTVKEPKLGTYQEVHDFGLISKLQPVKHIFYLPNEGNAPMLIDSVIAECGCTTPEIDNLHVLPGEKAQLLVTFDPFGKKGHATKTVTIYIRGMEPKRITLEADIEK